MAETMSSNSCRICMSSKMHHSSIFSNDLSRKITEIADVEVQEGDGLPPTICEDCEVDLDKCYKFRVQIQWADSKFRENLSVSEVVFEECQIKQEIAPMHPFMNEDNQDNEDDDDDRGPSDNDDDDYDMREEPEDKTENADKEGNQVTHPLDHVEIIENRTKQEIHMPLTDQNSQEEPLIVAQNMKSENEPTTDPLMHNEPQSMETDNILPGPSTSAPMGLDTSEIAPDTGQGSKTCQKSTDENIWNSLGFSNKNLIPRKRNRTILIGAQYQLSTSQSTNTIVHSVSTDLQNENNVKTHPLSIVASQSTESQMNLVQSHHLSGPVQAEKNTTEINLKPTDTYNFVQLGNVLKGPPKLFRVVNCEGYFGPKECKPIPKSTSITEEKRTSKLIQTEKEVNERNITTSDDKDNYVRLGSVLKGPPKLFQVVACEGNIGPRESKHSKPKPISITEEERMGYKIHNDVTCFVCNLTCIDKFELQQHLTKKQLFCRVCISEFDSHSNLARHFVQHKGTKCITCGDIFFCIKDKKQHLKSNSSCDKKQNKTQCELCGKVCSNQSLLEDHRTRKHLVASVSNMECVVCKKELSTRRALDFHLKSIHVAYEYLPCNVCKKLYVGPNKLKLHMNSTHLKDAENFRPSCHICSKVLKDESSLRVHLRRHDDQIEGICELCGQTVKGGTFGMKQHQYSVHPKKPISCSYCFKEFSNRSQLHTHKLSKHRNPEDFAQYCEICGKKIKNKNLLKQHYLTHSDQRNFKCSICRAMFKCRKNLTAHNKIHTRVLNYSCNICGKSFRSKQTFDKHIAKCNGLQEESESTTSQD